VNLNSWYFVIQLVVIGCSTAAWCWAAQSDKLLALFPGADVIATPLVGIIVIFLAFFVGFGGADMREQNRALRHFAQEEANQARSVLRFAEGVGPSADQLREALIEYLQAATTVEQAWIKRGSRLASPAQPMADALVLSASIFTTQAKSSDVIKTLIITAVERLRQARLNRLGASLQFASLPEWLAITVLVLISHAMIAFVSVGKPRATLITLVAFSSAVVAVYIYLAWVDGLIGVSKAVISVAPLQQVLSTVTY
jgi:hypothetical protein